jgi:hypothetical protein
MKRYDINQCALFGCRSKRRLREILFLSKTGLVELTSTTSLYRRKEQTKKNGSIRVIHAPCAPLKRAQKRISELLMRLGVPEYLMCPVRGRSNIDNAADHSGAAAFRFLDIESFFPNCTSSKIYNFFSQRLKCSPDVSFCLTRLVTLDGCLPQGSPSSPILAFWAYKDMWDQLNEVADQANCRMTIWVDDITVSGRLVPKQVIFKMKQIIEYHGHSVALDKEGSSINVPSTVTGVVVKAEKLLLPNRLHKAKHDLRRAADRFNGKGKGESLLRSLAGLNQFQTQILKKSLSLNSPSKEA